MSKITFILGGARSGKSAYAQELGKRYKKVAFIATCEPLDPEMVKRIKAHQKSRPSHWDTFEAPKDIVSALEKISYQCSCIIIDCLTLLVSNLILSGKKPEEEINRIITSLKKFKGKSIIVSNEVGLGIVPKTKLGRDFRDIAGRVNQMVAKEAKEVIFMVSGIPWRIK